MQAQRSAVRFAARILIVVCAVTVAATAETVPERARAAGNWPQFRGPDRDGVSKETGLLASWPEGVPRKLYTTTWLGRAFSSVSVAGGRVYTMGDRGNGQFVIALDEETGKELWATRIGSSYASPDDFNG